MLDKEVLKRVEYARIMDLSDSIIRYAIIDANKLFVFNCTSALRILDITQDPYLSRLKRHDLENFTFQKNGRFLSWRNGEYEMAWDAFEPSP